MTGPELFEQVYGELRGMAAVRLTAERPGHTLSPTALVNEVYLRLFAGGAGATLDSRRRFFAAAAEAMRRVLIDAARRRQTLKRAAAVVPFDLDQVCGRGGADPAAVLAVDVALDRLAAADPEAAELVRLRAFAGVDMAEAAALLDRPLRSVERTWAYARAWVGREFRAVSRPAGEPVNGQADRETGRHPPLR